MVFRTEDVACTASRRRRLVRGGREMRDGGRMGGHKPLTKQEKLSGSIIQPGKSWVQLRWRNDPNRGGMGRGSAVESHP